MVFWFPFLSNPRYVNHMNREIEALEGWGKSSCFVGFVCVVVFLYQLKTWGCLFWFLYVNVPLLGTYPFCVLLGCSLFFFPNVDGNFWRRAASISKIHQKMEGRSSP